VLGWAAALVAVFVAYVRALGASVGAGQLFLGPMAKPHRMALMTAMCVFLAIFPPERGTNFEPVRVDGYLHDIYFVLKIDSAVLPVALGLVIAGGIVTSVRRLRRTADFLRSKVINSK
jgi:hypothetical protein